VVFTGSPAHVSALSGPTVLVGIRPVTPRLPPGAAASSPRVPVAFRRTGIRLLGIPSRRRSSAPLTIGLPKPSRPGPRRGFHVSRIRDTTGVGAPYTPRPVVFPRPTLTARSPLAASSNGQALSPWYPSRRPGLEITRHQQGFTCVHPSGLPLARCSPGRNGGPSAFFPGLRTPTDRTRGRTPERGSISNTDRELRTRHNRPPTCEFTRHTRPRVAREKFPYSGPAGQL
jgi:hypothetical protein